MPINTTNVSTTYSMHPKNVLSIKKDPLKQQNDPFLRDLTACLQMKQQQKKLNESSVNSNSYSSNSHSESSNGSFFSSKNQIENQIDFNVDLNENFNKNHEILTNTNTTKTRFNLNLNHSSSSSNNINSKKSLNDKFTKPSFNLNPQTSEKSTNKLNLELPIIKVRATSPGALLPISIQAPPSPHVPATSSALSPSSTTPGSYNVTIKTPIMDRRCILNISCQTNANHSTAQTPSVENKDAKKFTNYNSLQPENGTSISTLASATFLNAASILKLDESKLKPAAPLGNSDVSNQKFKSPTVLATSILTPQKQNETTENDDSVVKTKLNHLKSFRFNAPTILTSNLACQTSSPVKSCATKVYATTSTQTAVITNSVSTNTELCDNLTNNSVSVGSSTKSPCSEYAESSLFNFENFCHQKNGQTQTNYFEEETSLVVFNSEKTLKTENGNAPVRIKFDMEQFLNNLSFNEFNKNDLVLLKEKFLPIIFESSFLSKIPRNINFTQHGLIRSLCMLKNHIKAQRKVSEKNFE
jgi:hypothetical protein